MATKQLFASGQKLNHHGHELLIEKNLSSGFTGEVYKGSLVLDEQQARIPVAVKAMKSLEFAKARELFYKEGETLSMLMHLESETSDILNDREKIYEELKIAPVYYGLDVYKTEGQPDIPYIVMEFIDGDELPNLLQQGVLSEMQSLTIAWHLYRIFEILHTRLKKTFIDLKFENLWWSKDLQSPLGGQLRMTDFGTLEEIKGENTRGIERDLLLGGVYLLSTLTGRTLDYAMGELREPAEPVIRHYTDQMTWGTRRLLLKLLHRNPDARLKNASDVLNEVRQLVLFWKQDEERLALSASKNAENAEIEAEKARVMNQPLSDAGMAAAARAISAMDILRVRGAASFDESVIERAKKVLAIGGYFERGFALLQGRSYQAARKVFEEGVLWSEDPAFLRRWSYVACIGEEGHISPADFEKRFPELKAILDFVNDVTPNRQKWGAAQRDFIDLANTVQDRPSLQSKGLDYLISECELYALYEQAQSFSLDEKFEQAADLYGQIKTILDSRLPTDAARLIEEEIGSATASRRNAEKRAARELAQKIYQDARTAIEQKDLPMVATKADEAFRAYRLVSPSTFHTENLSKLAAYSLELIDIHPEWLDNCIRLAFQLMEIGSSHYFHDPKFDRLYEITFKLSIAAEKQILFDTQVYCGLMREAHDLLPPNTSWLEKIVLQAAERAKSAENVEFLRGVVDLFSNWAVNPDIVSQLRHDADEIFDRQSASRHSKVDELIDELKHILLPLGLDPQSPQGLQEIFSVVAEHAEVPQALDLLALRDQVSRLEKAKSILGAITVLLGENDNYHQAEVQSLQTAVNAGLQDATRAISTQANALRTQRSDRLAALSAGRMELARQLDWARQGREMGLGDSVHDGIDGTLRQKLLDFLYRCYQAEAGDQLSLLETFQSSQKLPRLSAVEQVSVRALMDWAMQSLKMFGAESWREIAELARQNQAQVEAEVQAARQAFEQGNLAMVAADIDRATPEWQSLQRDLARVSAWQAWCDSKARFFQEKMFDEAFWKDLRAFSQANLPLIYWQQSPAPQYLDDLENELQQEMRHLPSPYSPDFVDVLRALLQVIWTRRLVIDNTRVDWDTDAWLKELHVTVGKRKTPLLFEFISQTPTPENIESKLASLTYQNWQRLGVPHAQSSGTTTGNAKKYLTIAGIAAAVCLLVFVLAGVAGVMLGLIPGFPAGTEPSVTPAEFTETPQPTATPEPTFTPEPTPTEMFTPTPVPTSAYLLGQDAVADLYPPVPLAGGEAYWLISHRQATFTPGLDIAAWKDGVSTKNPDNKYVYTGNGEASVVWAMDVPVDVSGHYAVYIVDTIQHSKGSKSLYVTIDGQVAQPYRGDAEVIFLGSGEHPDRNDVWQSLGAYQVNAGQTLHVGVDLPKLGGDAVDPFSADRVLIVRLDEPARQMLDLLPAGRPLVSLLDDGVGIRYFQNKTGTSATFKDTPEYEDVLAWNGSMTSLELTDANNTAEIWAQWQPPHLAAPDSPLVTRLAAGTYEVQVWIPAQYATAEVEYFLVADGKVVERASPVKVNQADYAGEWVTLGIWELPNEAAVTLRLVVEKGTLGEVGLDAVAILRVE